MTATSATHCPGCGLRMDIEPGESPVCSPCNRKLCDDLMAVRTHEQMIDLLSRVAMAPAPKEEA